MPTESREPTFTPVYMRLASAAAMISALTTIMLWWLPRTYDAPSTFAESVALHAHEGYVARLRINFVHVFFALAAYGAAAARARRRAPAAALVAFVAFAFWSLSEAIGVAIQIFGVNGRWRAAYAAADIAHRQLIRNSLHTFEGLWDGIFFVVLVTFCIGTMAMAFAVWGADRLSRLLSVLFMLAAPLTVVITLDEYFGFSLTWLVAWAYPVLQPTNRALICVWLLWPSGMDRLKRAVEKRRGK